MLEITLYHDDHMNVEAVEINGEASTMDEAHIHMFIADLDADGHDYIITNHYI